MSFDKDAPTQVMTVMVTNDHIRQTLETELIRRKARDLARDEGLNGNTCGPKRGYCSSCPIANAIWEELEEYGNEIYTVDVTGGPVEVTFTNGTMTDWRQHEAGLPAHASQWIDIFDRWIGRAALDQDERSVAHAEALLAQDESEWPALPAPITLAFHRWDTA